MLWRRCWQQKYYRIMILCGCFFCNLTFRRVFIGYISANCKQLDVEIFFLTGGGGNRRKCCWVVCRIRTPLKPFWTHRSFRTRSISIKFILYFGYSDIFCDFFHGNTAFKTPLNILFLSRILAIGRLAQPEATQTFVIITLFSKILY